MEESGGIVEELRRHCRGIAEAGIAIAELLSNCNTIATRLRCQGKKSGGKLNHFLFLCLSPVVSVACEVEIGKPTTEPWILD